MIERLLIANRSEIARRIMRTCRTMGIGTVAVYSDADAESLHVSEADRSVRLPGVSPADTYLRIELLVEAALRSGADALHPGYGFLSENAEFARAVIGAGLTWVGPPPEAIEAMGSKVEAKAMMAAAGVPVLDRLAPEAIGESDLPVLVKASAGGGGRGMRVVTNLASLATEIDLASIEAASAFGDPTVFCERYLPEGHHIEVQVFADAHGTVWVLGERECSIQRRHQKIVEETPSPLVRRHPSMRERLFEASRAATRAIGYRGAGTVEFLASADGEFHFLEMNTRLQVEHPVTEATTGLDLVALQLRIAEGAALEGGPPEPAGHAIEVRLYAEDPASDWQPFSGTLHRFEVPGVDHRFDAPTGPVGGQGWLRLDSGVASGSEVGVHYDPMLAKLIAWAPQRHEAARRLAAALSSAHIHGPGTNRDLLVRILRHPGFLGGETDTAFISRHGLASLAAPLAGGHDVEAAAVAAALAASAANHARASGLPGVPNGWRNMASQPQRKAFSHQGSGAADGTGEIVVDYRFTRDGVVVVGHDDLEVRAVTADRVLLARSGVLTEYAVAAYGAAVYVDSPAGPVRLEAVDRFPEAAVGAAAGSLLAPMPGVIFRIAVAVGERVERGQPLLWLEAMKMQHQIVAPEDGTVTVLHVTEGEQVDLGTLLAVVAVVDEG